jgi:hypothetical protein
MGICPHFGKASVLLLGLVALLLIAPPAMGADAPPDANEEVAATAEDAAPVAEADPEAEVSEESLNGASAVVPPPAVEPPPAEEVEVSIAAEPAPPIAPVTETLAVPMGPPWYGSPGFFLALIVLLLIVFGVSIAQLWRWKLALSDRELTVSPSDNIHALDHRVDEVVLGFNAMVEVLAADSKSRNKVDQRGSDEREKLFGQVELLSKVMKQFLNEFKELRDEIAAKSAEIERYREGYDLSIAKRAAIALARNHALLEHEVEQLSDEQRRTSVLIQLRENLAETLDEYGADTFAPEIGSRFRDARDVRLPPMKTATDDPDRVGTVAGVRTRGYRIEVPGGKFVVLLPAEVIVYEQAKGDGTVADDEETVVNEVDPGSFETEGETEGEAGVTDAEESRDG